MGGLKNDDLNAIQKRMQFKVIKNQQIFLNLFRITIYALSPLVLNMIRTREGILHTEKSHVVFGSTDLISSSQDDLNTNMHYAVAVLYSFYESCKRIVYTVISDI